MVTETRGVVPWHSGSSAAWAARSQRSMMASKVRAPWSRGSRPSCPHPGTSQVWGSQVGPAAGVGLDSDIRVGGGLFPAAGLAGGVDGLDDASSGFAQVGGIEAFGLVEQQGHGTLTDLGVAREVVDDAGDDVGLGHREPPVLEPFTDRAEQWGVDRFGESDD